MIQKIKILPFTLSSMLALTLPALVPAVASAATNPNIRENLCKGAELSTTPVETAPVATTPPCGTANVGTFQDTLATIINIISILVGVVAVIMIIYGGFKYITSGGKEEGVKGAKNTILYGLIGLVIVALAQIIVKFVLNQTTKVTG